MLQFETLENEGTITIVIWLSQHVMGHLVRVTGYLAWDLSND